TYLFPIILSAFFGVLLPKVARFTELSQFRQYIKSSLKVSFVFILLFFPILFFAEEFILFLFSEKYQNTTHIFQLLAISKLTYAVSMVLHISLVSMNKPHIIAITDFIKLMVFIGGCYLTIPLYGEIAPAIVTCGLEFFAVVFLLIYVFSHLKKEKEVFHDDVNKQE
ncbi:MAG: polysaccharide biosynthesis C-terminal domain-containing protein, partial [Nitrospinae bacterium]|nr:polysaccharide biosynthesis C-terminal domain-containing protein [Nitrospinota bacterium]